MATMENETLYYFLLIVITLGIAAIIVIVLRKFLNLFILKYSSRLRSDPTNFSFLKNAIGFIVFSIAIFFIFTKVPYLNSLGTALFAGAGIFAAVIALASQKAFSNIVSGIFILIFKPFRVNDTIEFVDSTKGVVEEITLRHTIIRDYENRRIVIPNGNISNETIINSNIVDDLIRKHVEFGISYDSNIEKATKIIQEEAIRHPFFLDNRTQEEIEAGAPEVLVRLISLGDFSVNLRAYVWVEGNDKAFALHCDLLKSVFDRFNKEGIEVPFPYRTIVYKTDIDKSENAEK